MTSHDKAVTVVPVIFHSTMIVGRVVFLKASLPPKIAYSRFLEYGGFGQELQEENILYDLRFMDM